MMQHSLVGESGANGAIENAIQRVRGQVRAIKLDLGDEHQGQTKPITNDTAVADRACCLIALCSGDYQGTTASRNAENQGKIGE